MRSLLHTASLVLALIVCAANAAAAGMRPGAGWYSANTDAAALAGGSARTGVFDAWRNPAALADSKVVRIGINYSEAGIPAGDFENPEYRGPHPDTFGVLGTALGGGVGISLPAGFGVLNLNIGADYDLADAAAYTNSNHGGLVVKGGFAKAITPRFHFGVGGGAIFSDVEPTRCNAFFDIGCVLLQNGSLEERAAARGETGFGFFDRVFSFAFNTGGYGRQGQGYSHTHAITGFEFSFFKSKAVTMGANLAAALAIDQFGLRCSGGLEMGILDILRLRGGAHLGRENIGTLALGAGIDFRGIFSGVNLDLSWAMVSIPVSADGSLCETAHFITLNYAFGAGEPRPDIASRLRVFSPNNDGVQDTAVFDIALFATEDIESWEIVIKNAGGNTVRRAASEKAAARSAKNFFTTLFASRARVTIPETWEWDGRDDAGKPAPDGTYTYQFIVRDTAGDAYSSKSKLIDIRQTSAKPVITLAASPKLFAPGGTLSITLGFKDSAIIASWKVVVKHGDSVFKTFTGRQPGRESETILWDGIGDSGNLVESAAAYTIEASAVDFMGNAGDAPPVSVDADILVVSTERGLKIVISSIEFAVGSAELAAADSPVLNRVADMLRRYPGYAIIIEGHTDNTGGAAYNRALSERRAQTAMRYLARRGIEERRMTARGLGQSAPAVSNATAEGRARNRRVEFILVKDAPQQ